MISFYFESILQFFNFLAHLLLNRQYFENSKRETSFIGYSSETTALAVLQATSEIFPVDPAATKKRLPLSQQQCDEVILVYSGHSQPYYWLSHCNIVNNHINARMINLLM